MKPPLDAWRGVTFAARRVRLERHGGQAFTRWTFSAAEPHEVTPRGSSQRLQALAVRFRPDGRFDPHWLLDGDLTDHGNVLSKTSFRGAAFSLYTREDVRLAMLGEVPIGAWVPFPGSHVTLASQRSEFFADNPNSRIVERYPSTVGVHPIRYRGERRLAATEPQYYPLGDFLGPNLVIWSEDPTARIFGTSLDRTTDSGTVTAILIGDTNFSTRLAVAPADRIGVLETMLYGRSHPRRAREDLYSEDVPGGTINLTVEKALGQRQYDQLKKRVKASPTTWVPIKLGQRRRNLRPGRFGLPSSAEVSEVVRREGMQQERYPPLPRFSGLNVFGPLRRVEFKGVHGNLMVADKTVHLGGPADVVLGDVEGLRDGGGHELISAPLATSRQAADVEFQTVGTAAVNGVSKTTVSSHLEPRLAIIGTVLTLLSALLAIVISLRRLGREEKKI